MLKAAEKGLAGKLDKKSQELGILFYSFLFTVNLKKINSTNAKACEFDNEFCKISMYFSMHMDRANFA